nr:probable LRR receptor-like serine/threonine-protein kinase At5g63710 isoform X1 [Ipomoea trifida]
MLIASSGAPLKGSEAQPFYLESGLCWLQLLLKHLPKLELNPLPGILRAQGCVRAARIEKRRSGHFDNRTAASECFRRRSKWNAVLVQSVPVPSEYLISVSRRHDCDQEKKKKADLVAPKTRTKERLKNRKLNSFVCSSFLGNNKFSGSIPADLGQLPNLKHLVLRENHLSGPIPNSLVNITGLKELKILWAMANTLQNLFLCRNES